MLESNQDVKMMWKWHGVEWNENGMEFHAFIWQLHIICARVKAVIGHYDSC